MWCRERLRWLGGFGSGVQVSTSKKYGGKA